MKCVIVANGEMEYSSDMITIIRNAQMVLCADGGARHLRKMNITPDILTGDFDSIDADDQSFFQNKKVKTKTFPQTKNYTDTELCLSYAIKKNATDITFLGVTGSRLDHTLANIFLLKKLTKLNIKSRIIDRHNELFIVTDFIELQGRPGELLSIIPVSHSVKGITLTGLEYPLKNADIKMGDSLGISNVFKESAASISIKKGVVIAVKSKD